MSDETWEISGMYMEACSCEETCPCVFLSPPTEGDCTGLVAWHIDDGHHAGRALEDLNVALALYSPGRMADGDWKVALYIDERADDPQRESLHEIFSGQRGGHPSRLAEFIGEMLGLSYVPLEFERDGGRFRLRIGDVGETEIAAIAGQDDDEVTIENHPLAVAPGYPAVVAESESLTYDDHGYHWEISERNGLFSPFDYRGG